MLDFLRRLLGVHGVSNRWSLSIRGGEERGEEEGVWTGVLYGESVEVWPNSFSRQRG